MESKAGPGGGASSLTRWWHDLRRFDDERLAAAIEQVQVERGTRGARHPGGWAAAADELLAHAQAHRDAGQFDAAWTALKAAQRELLEAFDATELTVEADRVRREAAAKLHGWRARAVEDALPVAGRPPASPIEQEGLQDTGHDTEQETEQDTDRTEQDAPPRDPAAISDLRARVKAAREILDIHADNDYRRIRLLRAHLVRALAVLLAVLVLTVLTVAGAFGTSPVADLDPIGDLGSLVLVMVLGALGAAISGVVTLHAEDRQRRIPDIRAQRLLVWSRPFVGAAAAVVVVAILRSGLTGVDVEPHALVAIALVAGFSERLVGRAVAAASAALTR